MKEERQGTPILMTIQIEITPMCTLGLIRDHLKKLFRYTSGIVVETTLGHLNIGRRESMNDVDSLGVHVKDTTVIRGRSCRKYAF